MAQILSIFKEMSHFSRHKKRAADGNRTCLKHLKYTVFSRFSCFVGKFVGKFEESRHSIMGVTGYLIITILREEGQIHNNIMSDKKKYIFEMLLNTNRS